MSFLASICHRLGSWQVLTLICWLLLEVFMVQTHSQTSVQRGAILVMISTKTTALGGKGEKTSQGRQANSRWCREMAWI